MVFFQAPTPSAHEIEARYAAMFGQREDLPLAVLVTVPVALLVILTAVFIRALEKAKQKHGVSLVKRTDMNGAAVMSSESCSNKESTQDQVSRLISGLLSSKLEKYTFRVVYSGLTCGFTGSHQNIHSRRVDRESV